MIGYFMNNILPRAGELVRPYSIARLESIPKSASFGTIVVERILDTATFLVLVAIIPLIYTGPLAQTFPWLQDAGVIILVFTVAFLGSAVAFMIRRDWTDLLLDKLTKLLSPRWASRVDSTVHSFLDGFLFLRKPGNFLSILALSIIIWGLYAIMTYLAFFSFDMQLDIWAAVVVLAISSIGIAIPTPGATGGYHWFVAQTLMHLFKVSNPVALSFATVTHAVSFIGTTVIGLYYFLHDHINIRDAMDRPPEAAT